MVRPSRRPIRVPLSLEPLLDSTLAFVTEKLQRRTIQIIRNFGDVPHVEGDPERLQQLFLNLFLNAADAMPDGGELHVTTAVSEGRRVEVRLNVIPIHIPPLRERPEDVPLLAENFVKKHSAGAPRFLRADALERLTTCSWKGNARELENVLERALALTDAHELASDDLPLSAELAAPQMENSGVSVFLHAMAERELPLSEVVDRYITRVLERTGGNKVRAARFLGVDRKTLYRRAERRASHPAALQEYEA